MVAPRGTVNDAIERSTPRRFVVALRVTGKVALELAVLKAAKNHRLSENLRRKMIGFRPDKIRSVG